jgi:hypothetical protein
MAPASERPPPKREGPAGGRGDLSNAWERNQTRPATAEKQGSRLRLLEWRPMVRNTLRGFASVELPSGLTIADISVHVSHGKRWASLPARPQITSDGTVRRGDDGKIAYSPVLKWRSRELQDGFSAAVVRAVEAEHGAIS